MIISVLPDLFYVKIIIVHHGFLAMFAHGLARLFRATIGFAYAHRISLEIYDTYDVVLFELAPHSGDTYGEDADGFVGGKYLRGAVVDV